MQAMYSNMKSSLIVTTMLIYGFVLVASEAPIDTSQMNKMMDAQSVEETTESPIADMALLVDDINSTTERPTNADVAVAEKNVEPDTKKHTVADFIIHPLIAFKARTPNDEEGPAASGKQATDTSTAAPSPWQFFGFTAGQNFGSSVSSLAGTVSNWLNPFPGLVDSPVQSSTSSSSTTTTTTERPDIVVRVQHKGSTRAPLLSINNDNRPHRFNGNTNIDDDDYDDDDDDSFEDDFDQDSEEFDGDDDDENENVNRNRRRNFGNRNRPNDDDDDDDDNYENDEELENDDEYEEDDEIDNNVAAQRPNKRRQIVNQHNRGYGFNRKAVNENQRRHNVNRPRRIQEQSYHYDSDESQEDENDDSEELYDHPSTKRSQGHSTGFVQRGPQSFFNHIRQLTRGQSTSAKRPTKQEKPTKNKKSNKRGQQTTVYINRNGQTVMMRPDYINTAPVQLYYPQTPMLIRNPISAYPQPALTTPLKRKGRPTQYITIPWAQLGIPQPDQLLSLADGIQSQPLILNIPPSAMQNPIRKKKRPAVTSDSVPLLAEASLMDVFKPPKIPASRTSTKKPIKATHILMPTNMKPAVMPTKKPTSTLLPQRIRPGTIVEQAPASMETVQMDANPSAIMDKEQSNNEKMKPMSMAAVNALNGSNSKKDDEFIIVGDDNEPGLTRQVHPVFGDARYSFVPYFEVLERNRISGVRKQGRALDEHPEETVKNADSKVAEQFIPVEVIGEGESAIKSESSVTSLKDGPIVANVPTDSNKLAS